MRSKEGSYCLRLKGANIGNADTGRKQYHQYQHNNQHTKIGTGEITQVDILRSAEGKDAQEDKADDRNGEQNLIEEIAPHPERRIVLSVHEEIGCAGRGRAVSQASATHSEEKTS